MSNPHNVPPHAHPARFPQQYACTHCSALYTDYEKLMSHEKICPQGPRAFPPRRFEIMLQSQR